MFLAVPELQLLSGNQVFFLKSSVSLNSRYSPPDMYSSLIFSTGPSLPVITLQDVTP